MSFTDFSEYDGLGLAQLMASGEVSRGEVLEASIAAIERLNPHINAVVHTAFDEARQTAGSPGGEGAFAGVPMLIKDLGLEVAGWPRTSGSRFCASVMDRADSGLTKRYRESGAVLVGRSACSEFGMIGTTETAAYGATRNPWHLDHIAGGSSGGAGAAVAAGMVPIAHASDGLGSIRIPAACCGLVGLKPTRDRVPNLPDSTDYALGFVCDHVLTRSVRDCAAMLDATGHPEPGSPFADPPKGGAYLDDVSRSPGRLRVRWSSSTVVGGTIDPDVSAVLEETADVLSRLGHDVRAESLKIDEFALMRARLPVSGANFAAVMRKAVDEVGREPTADDIEAYTLSGLTLSRQVTGEMVFSGLQTLRHLTRQIVAQFTEFDVFLSPVMVAPPPPLGSIDALSLLPGKVDAAQFALYPFALTFNFTGQPSMSLPLGMSSTGVPIGMMITARYGDEATLFRLAGQLEKEMPWHRRRPVVWG